MSLTSALPRSIASYHAQLLEGATTVDGALSALLARQQRAAHLNALIGAAAEPPLHDRAQRLDETIAAHGQQALDELTLLGVPLVIKDNICQKHTRTSAGSKILENFVSPYDATVIARLREAGALLVGKANLDEFAMGSSNEHSAFGPVKNPHDPARVPGGSSGGSAAAVAAELCLGALGSDTGGSIRQPAAHCGVVGFKPTYGRVSRFGLIAFASSLDQIGPLTHCVEDAARLFQVIGGHDARDATSSREPLPHDLLAAIAQAPQGLRVGLPREYFQVDGLDNAVRHEVMQAAKLLEDAGATLVEVSLPHTEYAIGTYYLIATAEASSNLSRYDGVRYGHRAEGVQSLEQMYEQSRAQGFGAEVKRRILLGTFVLSAGFYDAYYLKAQQVRTLIRKDFEAAWQQCDVILAPTTPTPAFPLGAQKTPLQMYLEDIYTISANLAGLPAISLPVGAHQGLPIGAQLMAKPFAETTLLRAAAHLERLLPDALSLPPLA